MYVPLREIAEVFAWMVGIVVGGFLFYVVLAFLYQLLLPPLLHLSLYLHSKVS